ncbi:hypothetical protein ACVIGB_000570 [Bradyrhizobium sp. USDA 4341]
MTLSLRRCVCALLALAICAVCTPRPASAWGDEGHQIIGLIAYKLLDPAVRTKVDAMLATDRDFSTAPDFVSRTTWADKYRDAARNQGGSTGTEKWHFTNIELADGNVDAACRNHPALPAGTPASAGPAACSVDKVEQFTAELADPTVTPFEKLLALKFLLHLVGDLHQPLHSADNRDGGGNGIYVVSESGFMPIKLHAYWDTEVIRAMNPLHASRIGPRAGRALLDRVMLSTIADGIANEYASRRKEWLGGRPRDWALDAFTKARDVAYRVGPQAGSSADGKLVYRIDSAYERAAVAVAREQIAKAGLRLAGLLNGALR